MAYSQASLALELFRPTVRRYVPAVVITLLVVALWVAAVEISDRSHADRDYGQTVSDESASTATVKAGKLDVSIYYFPDAATGTDRYVEVRDSGCGGSSAASGHDYPEGWMKP